VAHVLAQAHGLGGCEWTWTGGDHFSEWHSAGSHYTGRIGAPERGEAGWSLIVYKMERSAPQELKREILRFGEVEENDAGAAPVRIRGARVTAFALRVKPVRFVWRSGFKHDRVLMIVRQVS